MLLIFRPTTGGVTPDVAIKTKELGQENPM